MKETLIVIILLIGCYALSWAMFIGIAKLITLCFSWNFSLQIATGIWLVICLIKLCFSGSKK